MTDPADFLRRHPEQWLREHPDLVNEWFKAYEERDSFGALAAVLPAILAAHEAELAGDAAVDLVAKYQTAIGQPLEWNADLGAHFDLIDGTNKALAAAYLAGRQKGREEAAKMGDDRVDGLRWTASDHAASNDRKGAIEATAAANEIRLFVEEIRSLP